MKRILLINPNSSAATTDMMVAIAASAAGAGYAISGATATRAPAMITSVESLEAAAAEVVEIAVARAGGNDGVIVAAFGDPGLASVKAGVAVPAVGIGESSMLAAAQAGRRFGVATTTPLLKASIDRLPVSLGLAAHYSGTRFADGDPIELMRDPLRLREALAAAVQACIDKDGAQAVIIGGGPLGQVAIELQPMFSIPVIAPIPAAVTRIIGLMAAQAAS